MSLRRTILLVCVSIALPATASAERVPSFHEESSARAATHIVVVDGEGRILESWKGDLRQMGRLPVDKLHIPPPQAISYLFHEKKAKDPERVSGTRMVLYLIREGSGWRPASLGEGMDIAVVWLENGRGYAFQQIKNPGPLLLAPLERTEQDLKGTSTLPPQREATR